MLIEKINIEIYDTETNSRVLINELTEIGSPRLIYNGSDDKFNVLMTSELHFNFEVNDGSSGKFLHLYTGSEKRYKAVLNDITNELTPVKIWEGFLLPEQYSEPYTSNVFYVNFNFTDGIGRLKNKYLDDVFYAERKSVIKIIAECLLLTGNDLPIKIAPAIVNAIATLKLSDIEINTDCYITDKGKKKDAYFILNALIESQGCKLFQYFGYWYIIGINRFKDTTIIADEYTSAGVYVSASSIVRESKFAVFEEAPEITLVPPFKTVEIDWDMDANEDLLPSDIVYQPLESGEVLEDPHPVKYWQSIGSAYLTLSSGVLAVWTLFTRFIYYNWYERLPKEDPFSVSIIGGTSAPLSNYIELINQYYVEGNASFINYITLDIEFKAFALRKIIQSELDNGDYNAVFYYDLLLNENTLVANIPTFTDAAGFKYDYKLADDGWAIEGKIKIDRIGIGENGYINLRLHVPQLGGTQSGFAQISFLKTEIKYYQDNDELFTKNRGIDYTTKNTVDIFHGDNFSDISKRKYFISDDYIWSGVALNIPEYFEIITVFNYVSTLFGSIVDVEIEISETDYNLIYSNENNLYKKKSGDAITWYHVPAYLYSLSYDGTKWYIFMSGLPENVIIESDTVYYREININYLETDKRYLHERWRRYEQLTEEIRHVDALARVYHDAVKEPRIKVEGDAFGLLLPLDVIFFTYITLKNYQLTRLDLDLSEGMTSATIIEDAHEEVTDYLIE